jgi:hypothetical protein
VYEGMKIATDHHHRGGPLGIRIALVATLVASFTTAPVEATTAAQAAKIQPGAAIVSRGGECTLNWIYDGLGRHKNEVFVGTAAHCVIDVGDTVSLQAERFGEPLFAIGKVAYISEHHDYSFIRVSPKHFHALDPSVKGHPSIPTGVSTSETAKVGDMIQFSGYGVGFHVTQPTRETRFGVLHTVTSTWWSALGPVAFGDSGGPAADITDGNKALGVVDVLCAGTDCTGAGGVTVEALLDDAAANGFKVRLRTIKE